MQLDIQALRLQRDEARREKQRLTAELRNTEKKRQRLRRKRRLMDTNDLLEVYAMRVREEQRKTSGNEATP